MAGSQFIPPAVLPNDSKQGERETDLFDMTGARMYDTGKKLTDMDQRRKRKQIEMEDGRETVATWQRSMIREWNGISTTVHTTQRAIDHARPREKGAISSPKPIRGRSIADEVFR